MRARTLSRPALDARLPWAAAVMAGAGAHILQAMAPLTPAVLRFGAICSGHPAFAPHCPACYAAAAIAAGAVGLTVSAFPGARPGRRR